LTHRTLPAYLRPQMPSIHDGIVERRIAEGADEHEMSFLLAWNEAMTALTQVEEVYISSGTKTAQKVLVIIPRIKYMVLGLVSYEHAQTNPENLVWYEFVSRMLTSRANSTTQAEKLDTATIHTVRDFILSVSKVKNKVFQPQESAQTQANSLVSGWDALVAAVARAAG
jgi:hypothetical protein